MTNFKKIAGLIVSAAFILTSCSDGSDPIDDVSCTVNAPSTYSYEFEGTSTVAYSGQAARLATAKDLYDAMNADMTVSRADLDALNMVYCVTPAVNG